MQFLPKIGASLRGKKPEHTAKLDRMRQPYLVFRNVKWFFTDFHIMYDFDLAKQIILHMNMSGFEIVCIYNLYNGFGVLWPVNLLSQTF